MRLRSTIGALLLAALVSAAATTGCRRSPAGPNLLLVTIETLRDDHVGATVRGVELTPNLDRLAARGVKFERAYAAASFTLPSLHSIATGEPPPIHRVRFWTHFGNRFHGETLPERLEKAGYATGFVHAAHGALSPYPILQRGWTEPPTELVRQDAARVVAAAQAWLDRHGGKPFFLWVHLFEPHTPYGPADTRFVEGLANVALCQRLGPADFPVQKWVDRVPGRGGADLADALYAADVRAADDAVGQLLADLDRRGLTERTVVCVTGDHGENLSHDPEPRWTHGVSTDEQLVHVPLLLAGPGVPRGRTDALLACHIDLAPTLLRLGGMDAPAQWRGRDLFGTAPAPEFVFCEGTTYEHPDSPFYCVTDGVRSLRLFSATAPWTVDLREETRPPGAPLRIDLGDVPAVARRHLDAWRAESAVNERRALEMNDPGEDRGELTPEQRSLLALGYLGGEEK